jgi:spore maturation protein B
MEILADSINILSVLAIPLLVVVILLFGVVKKVKLYETFIEGAKEGFQVGVRIIPYLVAMLIAIGIFRTSGAMEILSFLVSPLTNLIGMPAETLPMALIRPLSGSGALGVMSEIMNTHGPDSLIGRMVAVMMGSGETTFYVLAVYFGSVGISRTRQAVPAGLIADGVSIVLSISIVRFIFG